MEPEMLRTREEWSDFVFNRGSSGEMVWDILKDWEIFENDARKTLFQLTTALQLAQAKLDFIMLIHQNNPE